MVHIIKLNRYRNEADLTWKVVECVRQELQPIIDEVLAQNILICSSVIMGSLRIFSSGSRGEGTVINVKSRVPRVPY